MTASERFLTERIGRVYIAHRWNCKLLGHNSAYDAMNHNVLFEVKTVTNSESNPKIHIAIAPYIRKQGYDGSRWVAILAVVLVDTKGNVVEARYGSVKQHCRFKSLMSEADFALAMAKF